MDEKRTDTKQICGVEGANLPEVMASLEMLTVNPAASSAASNGRILRKRIPKKIASEILNRRCTLKPKKRKFSEMDNESDIKKYYLDKDLKRLPNTLETIFEEREDSSENSNFIGVKKFKRMIQFQGAPTASKLKKRQAKIKRVFGSKLNHRRCRTTMQSLLDKLNDIQLASPAKIEAEVK